MTITADFTDHARGRSARAHGIDLRGNPFCRETEADRHRAWLSGWKAEQMAFDTRADRAILAAAQVPA